VKRQENDFSIWVYALIVFQIGPIPALSFLNYHAKLFSFLIRRLTTAEG